MHGIGRWINQFTNFSNYVSAGLLIFLVFLTCQQVVARYIFSASSVAMQELEWHIFGAIFLLATAKTWEQGGHVRVDLLYCKLSSRRKKLIDFFGIIAFMIPSCCVIFYYGVQFCQEALSFQNPNPIDHYCQSLFNKESSVYQLSATIESWLRTYILVGEISPDPGGLEARWIIKAMIPLSAVLLLLQAIKDLVGLTR